MKKADKRLVIELQTIRQSLVPISSVNLAENLACSTKTIKNDIKYLNSVLKNNGAEIKSKPNSGYTLQINDQKLFNNYYSSIFDSENISTSFDKSVQNKRVHYILRNLLTTDNYIKIEDISDEIYASRTSINLDIKELKEYINGYNLEIVSKPCYGIKLKGSEFNIRQCLVDEIDRYMKYSLPILKENFTIYLKTKEKYFDKIEKIIFNTQSVYSPLEISYNSMQIIINLIIVTYLRRDYILEDIGSEAKVELMQHTEYLAAKYTINACKELLGYQFREDEIYMLSEYLLAYQNITSLKNCNLNSDEKLFYFKEAENIIKYICTNNGFKFLSSDLKLSESLTCHLIPLFYRTKYNLKLFEASISKIKAASISVQEIVVSVATYFKDKYNVTLNENELLFMGYCFFPVFGRFNVKMEKVNIILINSINKNVAQVVEERLRRNFNTYINKIKICDIYELSTLNQKDYDYIFTDLPSNNPFFKIPVIPTSPFFSSIEKSHYKDLFTLLHNDFNHLLYLFTKEHFYSELNLKNKNECFNFIKEKLNQEYGNIFDDNFIKELEQRDSLVGMDIKTNVAIGKTISSYLDESFIYTLILNKPIIWNNKNVRLIIIYQIGKKDQIFSNFFENGYFGNVLIHSVLDKNNLVNILNSQDYNTFISVLTKRIKLI